MKSFKSPRKSLGALDADVAAQALVASADVAIVVDQRGVIRDSAFGSDELGDVLAAGLVGQAWVDTVSPESRAKVGALLAEAATGPTLRARQLNQRAGTGTVPLLYRALPLGDAGRILAIGRDLRPMASLQNRLVEAEQSIVRDYARIRSAEARYRLLFQVSSEPVLVLEGATRKILDANPAAIALLGGPGGRLAGRQFPAGLDAAATTALEALLAEVLATGRGDGVRVRVPATTTEYVAFASLFRQDDDLQVLVRLAPAAVAAAPSASRLPELLERLPDGFVVTTAAGLIRSANRAFLDLIQLATEVQVRGESLERWLGRPGVDLPVLLANLREHGSVRAFATTVRGELGATAEVEIAAVAAGTDGEQLLGFAVHVGGARPAVAGAGPGRQLPRSVEQLAELVGRVPLKDLVRQTTDVIERLCIEAALELTHDNRASAAEMLGLSRQSLYLKLRRYGLGDLDGERA
ncbi:MAG: transcriptional regulator PpsR [Chromatiales bacterium]|nr:transcriptional regulator PpsR [Chromatiales bacterium]